MLRKKKIRRRYFRTSIALLLAAVLALQGTSPLFVQAKDVMGNTPRTVDFSRPEALRSLEEAGVEEGTPQGARFGQTASGQGGQGGSEESQGGQPQEKNPAGETNASGKANTDDKENSTGATGNANGTGDSTGNGSGASDIGVDGNKADVDTSGNGGATGKTDTNVDKAGTEAGVNGMNADKAGTDNGSGAGATVPDANTGDAAADGADWDTDVSGTDVDSNDAEADTDADSEEGKIPSDPEAEGREPEDFYPIPDEPEGELVSFDGGSRTYRTGDGQYTTVIGGYVGTYQDDGGEFKLADNTLVEPETTAYAAGAGEEANAAGGQDGAGDAGFVHNKQNDYLVVLPKNITPEAGMVLVRGGDTMEIVPQGGDFSHSVVKDNAIRYNQVYDGIDVQYTVLNENIKEDIILRKPMGQDGFTYELKIPGLKAALVDNQVYIYPEDKEESEARGEARFILEAPSMEDAAGEVSVHIEMGLRVEEDGRVLLTVTPDKEWLADEARQYPVRIDPSTVNVGRESFSMIGVEQGSPNVNIGDNNYPYVGYDDGIVSGNIDFGSIHQICRTYIKITGGLESIPADVKIDGATFSVSQRTNFSKGSSQFGLYRVDDAWDGSVTWMTQPGNHTFIDVQNASPKANQYIQYNVKELVNDWVQGTYANNGMVLKAIDEASGLDAAMQCEVLNNRNSVYGPTLTVEWSPAEDPFLRDLSLDDTTITLRPMTEKAVSGKLTFDGIFADGLAKSGATVEYYLVPDEEAEEAHRETKAEGLYTYPDSTAYNLIFPEANKYYGKDSNWQGTLYAGLEKDKLYTVKARASKANAEGEIETGKEITSDSFLIYEVKQFDTLPKIARYYGVPLADLMRDNQVQDALVIAGNTLFVRNPQTNVPYSPAELTDIDKMKIDGALMGRGLHCEFGFEPVNLNTGNFYMEQEDASLADLGGTFAFMRDYNSKGTDQVSMFGRGWSFEYERGLTQTEDGGIFYTRGDGGYLYFARNEDGNYSAPAGYVLELRPVHYDGTDKDHIGWELVDEEKKVWSFDKYGVLRFVTDRLGFTTTFDYDEAYALTKITLPSGKAFVLEQDARGFVTHVTRPDGGELAYEYDENHRLIAYTNANGGRRAYHYDENGLMTSWEDENGNTVVTNTYDEDGRVVAQTDANGNTATFAYADGQTTTTDNEGNVTVYHYDEMYRTTLVEYPDGTRKTCTYDGQNRLESETTAGGTKTYVYDGAGNVVTMTREDGVAAHYTYNEKNQVTSVTNYDGGVTTMQYNEAGDLVRSTDANGNATGYEYDESHRVIAMTDGNGIRTAYAYDGANLVSYTDGNGNTWGFGYNGMGLPTSMTDPLGNVTAVGYDMEGNKVAETAADGGTTRYGRDAAGNITSVTEPNGQTTTYTYDAGYRMTGQTLPDGGTTTYTYDKNGNQTKQTDALGNVVTTAYDSMGRVISQGSEEAGTVTFAYDAAGNLTAMTDGAGNTATSEYDVLGRQVRYTDSTGNVLEKSYDLLGNVTETRYADGGVERAVYDALGNVTARTDVLGATFAYRYDAKGRMLSETDGDGRVWSYAYDNNGNLLSVTNPEGGVVASAYDAANRQVSVTDEEGRTAAYEYDGAGRVTKVTNGDGSTQTMKYDANGNLVEGVDGNGNISRYTYNSTNEINSVTDPNGNLTALQYDALGNLEKTVDSLKGETHYAYDSRGNVLEMTDALGRKYAYAYDKTGNHVKTTYPTGDVLSMEYDGEGRLLKVTDVQGLSVEYTYDGLGRTLGAKDGEGHATAWTYDAAGNVTSQTDSLGRVTSYAYDKYGRLLQVTEADGSVTTYEYDVMDRLAAVTDAEGHRTTFAYDRAGNLVSMSEADGAVWQYAYDQINRLVSQTDPLGGTSVYAYDGNGNLVKHTDENGVATSYAYDGNDNLTGVTDGNGNTYTYEYDELDRLIKEVSAMGRVQEYRYDALGNLTKYKDPMELITEYEYDVAGNMIKEISPKGLETLYGYDKHGNVTSVTDPMGNVTEYGVDLDGNVTKITLPNGGEYRYAYDKAGRITRMTSPLGYEKKLGYDLADNVARESDSLGSVTTYTYDRLHNVTSMTDALDGTSSFGYDAAGNLTTVTDALGRTDTYAYDLAGRLVALADPLGKVTGVTYDPAGNITSLARPGGRTTNYEYDNNYNLTSVTDPMGYVERAVYDKDGWMEQRTDALGQDEKWTYDANGRVTAYTNKKGDTNGYEYDPHGNVITLTDFTGVKSHFEYDANDNLIKVTDPLGNVTKYGYDVMGNMTSYVDARGKVTKYTYDLEGNLTSREDPAGRKETFGYDEKGRLTSWTMPSGKKVKYDYDKLNNLLEKSYEDAKGDNGNDEDGGSGSADDAVKNGLRVIYAYNGAGERVAMQDVTGKSTYEYDALGRLSKVANGSGKEVSYVYDEADNLAAVVYPDGTRVSYEYDLNDNIVKVTDREGKVTEYAHDALNRVTGTIRPNGTRTEVTYDAEDHVTKLVNTCEDCGTVISSYEYAYNAQGYIVSETATELEAGSRKDPSWDEWYGGCTTGVAGKAVSGGVGKYPNWNGLGGNASDGTATDGNATDGTADKCHEHDEKSVTTKRTYEYNDNWELTRCTEKSDGNKTVVYNYEYDKVGNRTVYERLENGVTKERYKYEYNDANQLVKRKNTRIWGDPGTTYQYDGDGNLVQEQDRTNHADPVKYEYTAENRLAVVSQGGTVLMAAMYDGDNNRVFQIDNTYKWEDCYGDDVLIPKSERTENGDSPQEELASLVKGGANAKGYTLTEYVNDVNRENAEVLAEYKADGTMRQAYTYGESGNGERIGVDKVDKSTETSYYMYDGRGSVIGLVTDDGTLTNSYTYDPYGTLTSGTADAVNYYGYNAESTNTKTGLQYLRARYYDPENGSFTSEDTEDGELPFPLTRNRYVYALNNPLNYKDPTGHKSKAVGKAVSGMAGGAVGGVMGAIGTRTSTKQKVNQPVKNVASAPRRSMQRETGNASGAASGHSKGGSVQASDSTGNKAGSMATGNTGKLSGMSGVTGNQRSSYKEQMAKVRLEQSRRVTCSAGQKNASAGVLSPDTTQELLQLLPLLTPEMLAALAAIAPWIALFAAGVMVAVYMPTVTHEIKPTEHEGDSKALTGDVLDANGHVIAKAGGGAPNPNRNNKKLAKNILRTAIQTKKVIDSLEKVGEVAETVAQAGSGSVIGNLTSGGKPKNQKGIGGKGWRGDKTWRENVKTVSEGGNIESINGIIPTEQEAIDLIEAAGGTYLRTENGHASPNPHYYRHVNYLTADGKKGAIRIQEIRGGK